MNALNMDIPEPAAILQPHKREFTYSVRDFNQVKKLIYDMAGISLAAHKQELVYNRLVRRLRALGFKSFKQYLAHLDESKDERASFINAMTTNLTSFFREEHHFDYLTDHFVPSCIESGQRKLRIWSSACSVGEEPYSIAISLLEAGIAIEDWDINIFATDIDTNVLTTAKAGRYDIDRVDNLTIARKRMAFLKGRDESRAQVRVKDHIKQMVSFGRCNLMERWPFSEQLDVIFCRNVMIYFDKETQDTLLERMTKQLKPGGILCLGHSETPARSMKAYQLLGRTMYRKI